MPVSVVPREWRRSRVSTLTGLYEWSIPPLRLARILEQLEVLEGLRQAGRKSKT